MTNHITQSELIDQIKALSWEAYQALDDNEKQPIDMVPIMEQVNILYDMDLFEWKHLIQLQTKLTIDTDTGHVINHHQSINHHLNSMAWNELHFLTQLNLYLVIHADMNQPIDYETEQGFTNKITKTNAIVAIDNRMNFEMENINDHADSKVYPFNDCIYTIQQAFGNRIVWQWCNLIKQATGLQINQDYTSISHEKALLEGFNYHPLNNRIFLLLIMEMIESLIEA